MRVAKILACGVLLGAIAWSSQSVAEIPATDSDGWHSWQVNEPDASIQMCCFAWKRGTKSSKGCDLDGHNIAFSDSGDCSAAPGTIQVYVRVKKGIPEDIRMLSSNCPVSTESQVTDHGLVSVDENISWFRTIIENRALQQDVREEALFALVISGSDAAYVYLDRLLTRR